MSGHLLYIKQCGRSIMIMGGAGWGYGYFLELHNSEKV